MLNCSRSCLISSNDSELVYVHDSYIIENCLGAEIMTDIKYLFIHFYLVTTSSRLVQFNEPNPEVIKTNLYSIYPQDRLTIIVMIDWFWKVQYELPNLLKI